MQATLKSADWGKGTWQLGPTHGSSQEATHLTVVMALKVWLAMDTMAWLVALALCSAFLVWILYNAAVAAVDTITAARMGPSRHDRAKSTNTCTHSVAGGNGSSAGAYHRQHAHMRACPVVMMVMLIAGMKRPGVQLSVCCSPSQRLLRSLEGLGPWTHWTR